jgi:hypothetical protein
MGPGCTLVLPQRLLLVRERASSWVRTALLVAAKVYPGPASLKEKLVQFSNEGINAITFAVTGTFHMRYVQASRGLLIGLGNSRARLKQHPTMDIAKLMSSLKTSWRHNLQAPSPPRFSYSNRRPSNRETRSSRSVFHPSHSEGISTALHKCYFPSHFAAILSKKLSRLPLGLSADRIDGTSIVKGKTPSWSRNTSRISLYLVELVYP